MYERFQPFSEHINKTGDHLAKATTSFNKMVSSLESRVLISLKKLKDFGIGGEKELQEIKQVEQLPRQTSYREDIN